MSDTTCWYGCGATPDSPGPHHLNDCKGYRAPAPPPAQGEALRHRDGCTKPLGKGYDIMCEGCGHEVASLLAGSLRGKLYEAERALAAEKSRAAAWEWAAKEAQGQRDASRAEVSRLTGELRRREEALTAFAAELERDAAIFATCRSEMEAKGYYGTAFDGALGSAQEHAKRLRALASPPSAPAATPAAQPAAKKE